MLKKITLLLFFTLCPLFIFAANDKAVQVPQSSNQELKGKVLIVVVDVSRSIENQIGQIGNVIDRAIVQNRLEPGDYFVLMKFGNSAEIVYSGQLLRTQDKEPITSALKGLKADNRKTDIGSAMHRCLSEIVSLKEQQYDLYEPLVLFITDGEIYTQGTDSPYTDVEAIFADPLINNKSLYGGWYFIGIQNEGKDLLDLPAIAKRAGREDYLLLLSDMNKLDELLNEWISKIPPSKSIEKGEIKFSNMKLAGKKLSSGGKSSTALPNNAKDLSWTFVSTYKKTPVVMEITAASAQFQDENMDVTRLTLKAESGKIELAPLAVKDTQASLSAPSPLSGKGTLKVSYDTVINGLPVQVNDEYSVHFMSQGQLLLKQWGPFAAIVIAIIILIIIVMVAKSLAPVKVVMEVVGKGRSKPVSMSIGKKVDFGSKAGLKFLLDHAAFKDVVGTLERKGKKEWKITPRDSSVFDDTKKLDHYKMRDTFKLKTRDGSFVSVKFNIKK